MCGSPAMSTKPRGADAASAGSSSRSCTLHRRTSICQGRLPVHPVIQLLMPRPATSKSACWARTAPPAASCRNRTTTACVGLREVQANGAPSHPRSAASPTPVAPPPQCLPSSQPTLANADRTWSKLSAGTSPAVSSKAAMSAMWSPRRSVTVNRKTFGSAALQIHRRSPTVTRIRSGCVTGRG